MTRRIPIRIDSKPTKPKPISELVSSATYGGKQNEYRYVLKRMESEEGSSKCVAFIGLNPSTATEFEDDPTVRRCRGFAHAWGFDGFVMLNIFAYRSTDPYRLRDVPGPIGKENDDILKFYAVLCKQVVCAWGTHGAYLDRGAVVESMLRIEGVALYHLGLTDGGFPKHPLYLRSDTKPILWVK